jgi:hypothetical protein
LIVFGTFLIGITVEVLNALGKNLQQTTD